MKQLIVCGKFKLPSCYSLVFINIIFNDYTTLLEIRNQSELIKPTWWEYLDVISNDMLTLVCTNLSYELAIEYRTYVKNNCWDNDLAIRRSCKNIDKAVEFLKIHFAELKGLKLKDIKNRHLELVK